MSAAIKTLFLRSNLIKIKINMVKIEFLSGISKELAAVMEDYKVNNDEWAKQQRRCGDTTS